MVSDEAIVDASLLVATQHSTGTLNQVNENNLNINIEKRRTKSYFHP